MTTREPKRRRADRRTGRPMPADPRVRVGSITKTFTAVTVLRLAAQGRVTRPGSGARTCAATSAPTRAGRSAGPT
ncbi:serine hydrolase [Actinomadura montaniterrae]|uniref:Beta-lactamase family protein n=1 Tax=Actinomadura montaniterrae TaxID=1803903 RepID=A0A6L3VE93_9ACTN|nr:serine hydrolase [Actinomadura montaniterrae]KAB2363077.1 beta-lactamase family protein [Actinomadura montaniterrae]